MFMPEAPWVRDEPESRCGLPAAGRAGDWPRLAGLPADPAERDPLL